MEEVHTFLTTSNYQNFENRNLITGFGKIISISTIAANLISAFIKNIPDEDL